MPAPCPGHPLLGRLALVAPGARSPDGWQGTPREVLGPDPDEALSTLRRLLSVRSPAVVELEPALATAVDRVAASPTRERRAPHEVGVGFTFAVDDLLLLLQGAAVDWRGAQPSWRPLDDAVALGARPALDGGGDIVLPDGSRAWIDGGPIRFTTPIDGIPVVHRTCIEHRSLAPFGDNDTDGIELADDQRAAVTHPEGGARIIAPAGSGKTRVLTERARHVIRRWRVPPSAITLVAFNKRAEEEMRERTRDLAGIQVRTLNAIALAIVNGRPPFAPQPGTLATLDEPEVRRIIGQLVRFPRRRNTDPVVTWIEALSAARLGLVDPSAVERRYDGEVEGFAEFVPRYRAILRQRQAVDFDEQVHRAIEILLAEPVARAAAQRACRLLLVDEFQDLTPAHLLLIRILAGADCAVFGVGDDDQTIYGYNGADPGWLIDFRRWFPGAGDHPLVTNYRCPGGIVRAADTLLRRNARRVDKRIVAARAEVDGFSVAESRAPGDESAPDTVGITVAAVVAEIDRGAAPADIAVLTRVNSLLAPVQAGLVGRGIPVRGGVGTEFLGRASVAASLAWMRLAVGGERLRPEDVADAVRRPSRSLHPRVADWAGEQSSVDGLRRLAARVRTPRDAAAVEGFADDIEALQAVAAAGGSTVAVLRALRARTSLDSTIAGLDGTRHGMNRASQFDDATALGQLAALHDDVASFEHWLQQSLATDRSGTGVALATVHRVKGQEWPFVIVHHAAADQFPHRLADDVEEERRLFHVAITRAQRQVLVVAGEEPSPFVAECRTPQDAAVPPVGSPAASAPTRRRPRPPEGTTEIQAPSAADRGLFERLRALRLRLAAGKPAYVVFPDEVLRTLAERRPATLAEMAELRGIGPAKLERYGEAVLAEINRTPIAD